MNTTMIITYFTNFITPLLTGFSFHTMKPLHNYLKTNIYKSTLKNNTIKSQLIITGFFHTLKPQISVVMLIQEYDKYRKLSNNNRNLGA